MGRSVGDEVLLAMGLTALFYGLMRMFGGGSETPPASGSGSVTIGTPRVVPSGNSPVAVTSPSLISGFSPVAAPLPGVDTLARTIWGEARGEGVRGMEAVAAVIMNRVRSGRFPNSIEGVCKQPWQFSTWNTNDPNLPRLMSVTVADQNFRRAMTIADRAARGQLVDPTGGALHYYANWISEPSWARGQGVRVSARIGKHIFLTGVA